MFSGFFKATPKNTSSHQLKEKPLFVWLDNITEDKIPLKEYLIGTKFYDGCTLSLADKNDADFIKYVENDLIQVQKDIDKLELLKSRLSQALK